MMELLRVASHRTVPRGAEGRAGWAKVVGRVTPSNRERRSGGTNYSTYRAAGTTFRGRFHRDSTSKPATAPRVNAFPARSHHFTVTSVGTRWLIMYDRRSGSRFSGCVAPLSSVQRATSGMTPF